MSKGNNKKIIEYNSNRLEEGNEKFKREMPLDFYTEEDILEEILDSMIYSSALILELREKGKKTKVIIEQSDSQIAVLQSLVDDLLENASLLDGQVNVIKKSGGK